MSPPRRVISRTLAAAAALVVLSAAAGCGGDAAADGTQAGELVGMNTLGAHAEAVLKTWLARGGLTPAEIKQVELVALPPVNTEQSLRQRQIDVAVLGGVIRDKAVASGVDHVVPVLRSRGLFRTEYTGRTLREHYGLPRPASAYAASALVSA